MYCTELIIFIVFISNSIAEKPVPTDDRFIINSPHNVLNHLDAAILKSTQNVTNNKKMDDSLYQLSKNLVSSVLTILEIQDKVTRITKEALDASGKNKRITAIETRRILDYISRTLANNILRVTKESTEYELHHLVYGISLIATETSIVSALKDNTFTTALSKKQNIDLALRKKRSVKKDFIDDELNQSPTPKATEKSLVYSAILNEMSPSNNNTNLNFSKTLPLFNIPKTPYDLIKTNNKKSIHIFKSDPALLINSKGFLNQTTLDLENKGLKLANDSTVIMVDKNVNGTSLHIPQNDSVVLDTFEPNLPELDEWTDSVDNLHKQLNLHEGGIIDIEQDETPEEVENEKKAKQKLDRLELKAKKAILYAGDIAYLAASSVVAMRRALTASTEVQMSVMLAKTGMSNHQELMMNLAKTAAQQVGKEAKIATSKSLVCDRMMKLAIKYTAQSRGAFLNHVANRIVMNTISLATFAKSMAYVSSDIAINSLYLATDVKSAI